jgi:hypothetical protein
MREGTRRFVVIAVAALILSMGVPPARAEIVLEWDFDHGALDPAGTTITDSLITLGPRLDIYASRWIHCRASGMFGRDPEFRISNASIAGSSLSSSHRYVYSYDREQWYFFDNGLNDGSYYRFWNDAPFTEDVLWFAYGLPYPLAFTEAHVEEVRTHPRVSPTASADEDLVIGLSNDGTLTDAGRSVPVHNMYGYLISDASAPGDKTVVVLTTGNHPNETTGTYTFQGMVDFLLSDDARAAALLRVADFYVYPQCNPDGRWAGHARTNPENPGIDHNRHWDDPVGFTDLTVLTNAMQVDTDRSADYFFDFHSFNNTTDIAIWIYPWHAESDFVLGLLAREPAMDLLLSEPDPPGVSRHWAHSPDGLDCEYTFTPECGFIPGWLEDDWLALGESYALALYDALVLSGCADPPTSGAVVFADDFDAGDSGDAWDLYTTSDDYTAEFAFDYSDHNIPPAPNSAEGTTIGAKFTVNNNDTIQGTEALSAYPIGQWFQDDYVLKFDMWINYNGGPGGGTGSTEFMHAGINQAGDRVNWPENPGSDGFSFAVTGEGGASLDYRAYTGSSMFDVASGVYLAGSQNHTAAFYQALFPSPDYETQGAPGKHWVEVAISQHKGVIRWRLNGTLVSTRSDETYDAGNVMIGYFDIFASVADPAEDNFIIYDNVRVEQLPETDCNDNGVPDACEPIGDGDFNADGVVDLGDLPGLTECLAGPDVGPSPPEPTCEAACLTAFDFDRDEDVDLDDVAEFQELIITN